MSAVCSGDSPNCSQSVRETIDGPFPLAVGGAREALRRRIPSLQEEKSNGVGSRRAARRSGPDRRDQRSHIEDRYHSLQVIGQNVKAHLGSDSVEGPGQEVDGALRVPNGCSTAVVARPMASGMSSRSCIVSGTSSCSQRLMIRRWVGVHRGLSGQVGQALSDGSGRSLPCDPLLGDNLCDDGRAGAEPAPLHGTVRRL
jgi:hypothetical protein